MEVLVNTPATIALVALNVIFSLLGFAQRDTFFEQNAFWVGPIRQNREYHRFVTSAFLHVGVFHLLVNMYVLFEFGRILETVLGTAGFILLYVVSLLAGNIWEYVDNFNKPNYRAVGASGATSGIVSAFCLFFPFAMLYVMFAIPMWAIVAGILFIVVSFVLSQKENTMIAHGAHLGGALAGLLVAFLLKPDALGELIEQVSQRFG